MIVILIDIVGQLVIDIAVNIKLGFTCINFGTAIDIWQIYTVICLGMLETYFCFKVTFKSFKKYSYVLLLFNLSILIVCFSGMFYSE
jgi:hypothetical protein